MPIKGENRDRYPPDWARISKRIRDIRAGGRCECEGECRTGKHTDRCVARNGRPSPYTLSKVVLTVAHLNHTPEDCRDENLKAMCQSCHLGYDRDHHAETAAQTRAAQLAAQMDPLFGPEVLS